MGAPILGQVLKALERIYTFRTAQKGSPEEFELDLPIQPVQDLGEIAKLGAAIGPNGGWWYASTFNVHVVNGSLTSTLDVFAPGAVENGFPDGFDLSKFQAWVYDSWADVTTEANFNAASAKVTPGLSGFGPTAAGGVGQATKTLWFNVGVYVGGVTGGTTKIFSAPSQPMPLLDAPGAANRSLLVGTSTADVAGILTVRFNWLIWIGPLGVNPPFGS